MFKNNQKRQGLIIAFLFAISMISISLPAQTYQPFPTESATWKVARCWYFFQPGWHDTYTLTVDGADTLYQGETYKQIWITQHLAHGPAFDSIYPPRFFGGLREEGKRIFLFQSWGTVDTTAHLVYDFNQTSVGDTIYTSTLFGPANVQYAHIVSATDSILVGSTWHKRLFLYDPGSPWLTEEWIEGIGSTWGLPFATVWSITDNSYDLTCFYQDGQLQYGNPAPSFAYCQAPYPESDCDSIMSSVGERIPVGNDELFIFPNPASHQVTVEAPGNFASAEVQIWSMMGQLVWRQKTQNEEIQIDIQDWTPGLYIITFRTKDSLQSGRFTIYR